VPTKTLTIEIKGNGKDLHATVVGAEDDMDRLGKSADRSGGGFSKLSGSLQDFGKVGLVAFGGVAVAAGGLLGYGVKIAGDMEQADVAFTTMLGSGEKAHAFLAQLRDFAAKTPFEFPELQEAASSLISIGVDADKVIPIMTSLGNATAGMGTGAEGVKRATVALQQMQAAGKITGEDLNQLRDAGIPVFDLLAAATGRSKEALADMAAKGKLGRQELDQLMTALESGKGLERFTGLMDAQSHTLQGMLSTLKDTFGQGLADLAAPMVESLKGALPAITSFVQNGIATVTPAVREAAGAVATFFAGIVSGTAVGGQGGIVEWAEKLGVALHATFGWLAEHKEIVIGALVAITTVWTIGMAAAAASTIAATWPLLLIGAAIAAQVAAVIWAWNNWDTFRNSLLNAAAAAMWLWNNALVPFAGWVTGTAVPAIVGFAQAIWGFVGAVWDGIQAVANFIGSVPERLGGLVEWFENLPGNVIDALASLGSAILGWITATAAALPGQVASLATSFLSWVGATLAALPGQFAYITGFIIGWVIGEAVNLATNLGAWTTSFVGWVVNLVASFPGWLASVAATVVGWIWSTAGTVGAQLVTWLIQFAQWVTNTATSLPGWLASVAGAVAGWIWGFASSLPGHLATWLGMFAGWAANLAGSIGGWLGSTASAIAGFISSIPGRVAGAVGELVEIGRNIADAIWRGIQSMAGWLADRVRDFGAGIVNGVKAALHIGSPSKDMIWVGQMIVAGVQTGIEDSARDLRSTYAGAIGSLSGGSVNLSATGGASGRSAAPSTIVVNVEGAVVASERDLGRVLVGALQAHVDAGGRLPTTTGSW
jgi:tape measure domain-containing protein